MNKELIPLSGAQQLLYLSQKYTISKQVNTICISCFFEKELDFGLLEQSILASCERHECLNVRLCKDKDGIMQYYVAHEPFKIPFMDFSSDSAQAQEKAISRLAHRCVTKFNERMYNVFMVRTFDGMCGIVFTVSHVIMDSFAISAFFRDVMMIYYHKTTGSPMPNPPASYLALIKKDLEYSSTPEYQKDFDYWREFFSTEPMYTHPGGPATHEKYRKKINKPDARYGPRGSLDGRAGHEILPLTAEYVQKLESFARSSRISPQSIFVLGLMLHLSKVNNNERDICIYSVNARRGTIAEKSSGGSRVHAQLLRDTLDYEHSIAQALLRCYEMQLASFRHFEINPIHIFGLPYKLFNLPSGAGYSSVSVTYQPVRISTPDNTRVHVHWYCNGTSSLPFYLSVMDTDGDGSLSCYYEYLKATVKPEHIHKAHSLILNLIDAAVSDSNMKIGDFLDRQ